MANFFDENDLVSQVTQSPSFFDEADLHSDESREPSGQKSEAESISKSRSALVGAGQGATLGFGEEITSPFVAAAGMTASGVNRALGNEEDTLPTLPDESTLEKFQRLMQEYRDVARTEQKSAQEQNPGSYMTGAVAGGLLTPGFGAAKVLGANAVKSAALPVKAAVSSGVGAGFGGIAGAGEAEGNLEERIPGAKEGAKTGAIIGGAIPFAVHGTRMLGELGGMAGEIPFIKKSTEAFKRGIKGENLSTETGRREAASLARTESGDIYNDIKALQKDVGSRIQSAIDEASESGSQVDLTEEVGAALEKLKQIKAEGSKDAANYASGVESEIKKVLGLKSPEAAEDLSKLDLPEGLSPEAIAPKAEAAIPEQILLDPKKAQDLKQVLSEYTPKKGFTRPQEIEAAGTAKELRSAAGEKLNEVSGVNEPIINESTGVTSPSLNKQYGLLKDSLKTLVVNEKKLPKQITRKINSIVSKLENEDVSGDDARDMIGEILDNIRQVSPETAAKYESSLADKVQRLKLSTEIGKGLQNFGWGTFQSLGKAGANITGLGLNKVGINKVIPAAEKTVSFANSVLKSNALKKGIITGETESTETLSNIREAAPHEFQRQVASAAENAEPETLTAQAQDVRTKYGKQGEQLATILDNMANKDKGARRALMFTILQNQAYRRMLGLTKNEEK